MTKGIYKITNQINNKCYIGKSCNIENRFNVHRAYLNQLRDWNKPLYRAFRKYGLDSFNFEIIEDLKEQYDMLCNKRERYWIKYYSSYGSNGYNGTRGGDGRSYGTRP